MGNAAERIETEPQWDGVCRREIPVTVRIIDVEERSVEVIASTESLDAHGDVVKQFWDLARYNKNGPVLWNHNQFESSRWSMAKLTLVKGNAIEEPMVDKLWRRIQQGVIKAVSVGFKPGQITAVVDAAGKVTHYELGSAARPNELREISFVPMGSNPDAVAKSIAWERKHLEAEITTRTIAEGSEPMAMTAEEQKQLADAVAAKTAAETRLADNDSRVKQLEKDLAEEKTLSAKYQKDLAEANAKLKVSEEARAKTELDARQGKKFAPTERKELDDLMAETSLERVLKLVDARPDLAITNPVTVEGKELPGTGTSKGAPEVTEADPSADIAKTAEKRATA
jgi:hypothetical protein